MKIHFNSPGLADVLSGWMVCKPTLQQPSLSFGIISLMTRTEMVLEMLVSSNHLIWLLAWESFTEFSHCESCRLHRLPTKVTQSAYQSRLLRQLKNHQTNCPKILYLEEFTRNSKIVSVLVWKQTHCALYKKAFVLFCTHPSTHPPSQMKNRCCVRIKRHIKQYSVWNDQELSLTN
jgi:hypothetical protein